MKRFAGLLFVATLLVSGLALATPPQEVQGNLGIFYSSLSPHGEWVNADVGFAWRPLRVGNHWRPYLHGRWAWTEYGWYWVSNEPFGWATFHYGRWTYDDYYGWIWIPDRVWGPAWVEWRYDDDYIGWAPLTPYAQFSVNVGIVWTNRWVAPVHYWNFLSCRRFTTARVADYVEPVERGRRIIGNTRGGVDIRSDRNRVINDGIDARFVERRTNVRVPRVDVVDRNDPSAERFVKGDRRMRIETYRPKIEDGTRTESAPAPGTRRRVDRPGTPDRQLDQQRPPASDGTSRDARGVERRDGQMRAQGREQERAIQERRDSRDQERRLQEQRESRSRERVIEQGQGRSRGTVQQQQRPTRGDGQDRSVRQEQRQARPQERPSINRGSQQTERERGPGRTPPQQGEQRARGRRPA